MSQEITLTVRPYFPKKKTIEERDKWHENNALWMLAESHLSMFEYGTEYGTWPETLDPIFLETYMQRDGIAVITDEMDGVDGLIVCEGCTGTDLDPYGIGREVVATTRNGHAGTFKRGKNCVVGWNNRTKTPCSDVYTDAQTLADIQTSIDFLIFWTRLSPLVRVSDEKMKVKVVEAFKNIKRGIPVTLASKKLLAEYGLNDDITVDMLTQPDFADKIQYTAKLYDDVLRWHYTRYGHATNGNSKAAQQTVDEVDSTASQSMILPLSMLWARRKMIDEINALYGEKYGFKATVELSGAWKAEVTAYEQMSGEDNIDDSADDPDAALNDPGDPTGDDTETGDPVEDQATEEAPAEAPIVIETPEVIIKTEEVKEDADISDSKADGSSTGDDNDAV